MLATAILHISINFLTVILASPFASIPFVISVFPNCWLRQKAINKTVHKYEWGRWQAGACFPTRLSTLKYCRGRLITLPIRLIIIMESLEESISIRECAVAIILTLMHCFLSFHKGWRLPACLMKVLFMWGHSKTLITLIYLRCFSLGVWFEITVCEISSYSSKRFWQYIDKKLLYRTVTKTLW